MAEEIHALEENKTWTVEELLPWKKPSSCKWVYKVKYKLDGTIERFKVRLVIRGDPSYKALILMKPLLP